MPAKYVIFSDFFLVVICCFFFVFFLFCCCFVVVFLFCFFLLLLLFFFRCRCCCCFCLFFCFFLLLLFFFVPPGQRAYSYMHTHTHMHHTTSMYKQSYGNQCLLYFMISLRQRKPLTELILLNSCQLGQTHIAFKKTRFPRLKKNKMSMFVCVKATKNLYRVGINRNMADSCQWEIR